MNVFLNDEKLEKVWEAIRKNFFPVPPESGTAQPPTPAMEGDVTIAFGRFTSGDYIGYLNSIVSTIGNKKVTTAKIDDAAVTTIKLADDAVETAKIKNLAVSTAKIADSAITQAKLALGAIAPTVIWTAGTTNGPTLTIQAGKDTSAAVAIPKASATASGVVTTAAQSFAGDKTFKGEVYGEKNIQAMRGVAAGGYADLSMSSGGGSGTVVAISVNGVTKEPVAGLITLDDYPLLSVYNSDKTGILNRLTVIEGKIPADASSSNQLADKAFVNSSINTATATHQGTYDVVNDLHLTASATQEQVAAALLTAVASRNPDKNDYVFVSFPATASAAGRFDRYKYDGTAWGYEYTLNNSSFTSAQWAAITSGITPELVAAFNAKYDKPSGGIPKSDLASDVQTSLGKADTALQTHQTIYDLVIQKNGVKMGNTYNPATGDQIINITDVASDADVSTLKGYFTNGVAKNAARLSNTAKIGDTNQPVYFTANGVPTPISYTIGRNVAANEDVTPYTAGDSIDITGHVVKVLMTASESPSASGNAIAFIDTISQNAAGKISATKKTIHTASATQLGLVKVGTGLSISEGVLSIGTGGVTNAMLANSKITIGTREVSLGGTLDMSTLASDVSTQLGLKSAALHEHGDYVTALGVDGKTLTWSKGGAAQDAITIPYAKESTTLETESLEGQEFIFRNSPKTIGADSLKLDRILGRTLVWNQLANGTLVSGGNVSISNKTYNGFTSTANAGSADKSVMQAGVFGLDTHIYYLGFDYTSNLAFSIQHMTTIHGLPIATTFTHYSGVGQRLNSSYSPIYWYLYTTTTEAWNLTVRNYTIVDLTLMFGSGYEPTAEVFERYYLGSFIPNKGKLVNNSAAGLETVGFNLWDEEWESGRLDAITGQPVSDSDCIRSKDYQKCLPKTEYYFYKGSEYSNNLKVIFYDENKGVVDSPDSSLTTNRTYTTVSNAAYFKLFVRNAGNPTYLYNICINLSDPNRNGQYEPYKRNVLDLHLNEIRVKSPNIWDEEWEAGKYSTTTGEKTNDTTGIRCKNAIPVNPNTTLYIKNGGISGNNYYVWVLFRNSAGTLITLSGGNTYISGNNTSITVPNDAKEIIFYLNAASTYNNDICINISDPAFNGRYFPHGVLTFNGLKQAGSVYDEIVGGKLIRRVGDVDLGTLTWAYTGGNTPFFTSSSVDDIKKITNADVIGKILCGRYTPDKWNVYYDKTIKQQLNTTSLVIVDSAHNSAPTSSDNWLSGVYANYELATYETYDLVVPIPTAMPAGTTERRLPEDTADSVIAPFACDMTYGTNPGDILASGVAWERIWGKPHTLAELGLDDMFIKHDKSNQSLTKLDRHLIKAGDEEFYLIFNAETDGSFTLRTATGLNNGTYENEEAFSLSTITDEQINAICHL